MASSASESAYLVPQPLARNDRDFIAYPLVGLEVEGELRVVALDDDFGGLLDGLRAYATHLGGVVEVKPWKCLQEFVVLSEIRDLACQAHTRISRRTAGRYVGR